MACIISAPSSGSGKTLLTIILIAWARKKGLGIQSFKVGPDYLDSQQLSAVSSKPCRNLDLILCGKTWIKDSFHGYGGTTKLSIIEGVMGLFDGLGASEKGSTADIAKQLKLPIVLVIDAKGQGASIGALVKGFRDKDASLEIAGVVLNKVKSYRHKKLLIEVLDEIGVKVLGCMPPDPLLNLPSRHLGLVPAHEISDLENKINYWCEYAEKNLDIITFLKLLKSPDICINPIDKLYFPPHLKLNNIPVSIAEDEAFHFKYPETQECLNKIGISLIKWKPTQDEEIPKCSRGLIIPGGFPEKFAKQISKSERSLNSIRSIFQKIPIYAECGGMLMLGNKLTSIEGNTYKMAGILPFSAKKGELQIGYRKIFCRRNSLITEIGDLMVGHEFHNWEIELDKEHHESSFKFRQNLAHPWSIKGWGLSEKDEGWSNDMFHASWIHLHWPSSLKILYLWANTLKRLSNKMK